MKFLSIVAGTALLLSGCGGPKPVTEVHHRQHQTPPLVEPPLLPADSFDLAAGTRSWALAQAAQKAGDMAELRRQSENALLRWPVMIEAWEGLIEACKTQKDADCVRYGTFFHAKLLVLNGLPMKAASLGFETIAENPVGARRDNSVYDQKTLDMATRLWVFCAREDPAHSRQGEPTEQDFSDAFPYVPMLAVIGVGAAVLTGIKSAANK